MFHIPDQNLWLGNAEDARELRQVLAAGIGALVDLAGEEFMPTITRDLIYCRIPLVDGTENPPELLRLGIQTIVSLLRAKIPTMVCCGASMSRAPSLAAAALAVITGRSPEELLRQLSQLHTLDVSPAFWHEVKQAAESLHS